MKKIYSAAALLMAVAILFAGCGTPASDIVVDPETVDWDGLKLPDWELPANSVFDVDWFVEDDDFFSGTSALIQPDFCDNPLLITAFHAFAPDAGAVSGSEINNYILGGDIYDTFDLEADAPIAELEEAIVLPDAAPLPDVAHDVAAFTVADASALTPFPIASRQVGVGQVLYLAAYLDASDYYIEEGLYPAIVTKIENGGLEYAIDPDFITDAEGVSGAPLLNSKGELVGIHLGNKEDSEIVRFGLSVETILPMLKTAMEK